MAGSVIGGIVMQEHNRSRIAIVAVHGVADQKRFKTQTDTARLLVDSNCHASYTDFDEHITHIPSEPVALTSTHDVASLTSSLSRWQKFMLSNAVSRVFAFSSQLAAKSDKQQKHLAVDYNDEIEARVESMEHEFTREQIQSFTDQGSDRMTDIKVLSATRNADKRHQQPIDVDVYEMHWSDLSRMKSSLFSAFFEFYLLLFFLSRLGTTALERLLPYIRQHRTASHWLFGTHLVSEYCLVVAIPILHLCLFTTLASAVPVLFESTDRYSYLWPHWFWRLLLFLPVALIFTAAFRYGRKVDRYWSWIYWFAAITAIGLLMLLWNHVPTINEQISLLQFAISILFLMVFLAYDKRRPGVFWHAVGYFTATLLLTGLFLNTDTFYEAGKHLFDTLYALPFGGIGVASAEQLPLNIAALASASSPASEQAFQRGVVASLVAMWVAANAIGVFVISTLLNFLIGLWLSHIYAGDNARRVARAIWTGSTTLVIPGLAIILITFSLWEVLLWLLKTATEEGHLVTTTVQSIIDTQIFPHVEYITIVMLLSLGYLIWVVSPGPLADLIQHSEDPSAAAALGRIVDKSFRRMNYACHVFKFILFFAIPASWFYLIFNYPDISAFQHHVVLGTGFLMLVLWFGSQGPIKQLGEGFGAGLDVALDVTNWLKTLPRGTNAKAAIFKRYVSLLRHVCRSRSQSGKPYDGLVLVAHSQGTVITADLLRFLKKEQHMNPSSDADMTLCRLFSASEPPLSARLLTFGSPLKQLYNRRFPIQYGWAGDASGGPDPDSLGLERWVNLYNSGDYVGRNLWLADDSKERWLTSDALFGRPSTRYSTASEKCTGFGGHTNYWAGDVPAVADVIDALVVESAGGDPAKKQ